MDDYLRYSGINRYNRAIRLYPLSDISVKIANDLYFGGQQEASAFKWYFYDHTSIGDNMKKNVAGQSVGCQMTTTADGTDFTGAVTVYITGDSGSQAIGSVGSGICVHEGNGYHSYLPSQAETNFNFVSFTFKAAGAITRSRDIYTSFPQTGDAFLRLGSPAGASVSADLVAIKADSAAILIDTAEIGQAGAGLTSINLPDQTMNITGNITSVTNLTNAATSGDLTAQMKNSVIAAANASSPSVSIPGGDVDDIATSISNKLVPSLASAEIKNQGSTIRRYVGY